MIRVSNHKQVVVKDQGKALQAIVCLIFLSEGVAPGYLHRKRCVLPSRQILAIYLIFLMIQRYSFLHKLLLHFFVPNRSLEKASCLFLMSDLGLIATIKIHNVIIYKSNGVCYEVGFFTF